MTTRKCTRSVLFGCAVLGTALLPNCGGGSDASRPLRIGANLWPGYEHIYLAEHEGLFDAAGVEVDFVEFASLNDGVRAFARGDLDGFAGTVAEYHGALVADGIGEPVIVTAFDYSNGADVIIGGKEILSMDDLKGRRIGVERGTLGEMFVGLAMQSVGLSIDDVKLVVSDTRALADLLASGEVDAVQTYSPFSNELIAGGWKTVFSSADIPGSILDVLIIDRNVVERRHEDVKKLLVALDASLELLVTDPDRVLPIVANHESLSVAEFVAALDGLRVLATSDSIALMDDGTIQASCETVASLLAQPDESPTTDPRGCVERSLADAIARSGVS